MSFFFQCSNPCCIYCCHSRKLDEDSVICVKKGVQSSGSCCSFFLYDPLKRTPTPHPVWHKKEFPADTFTLD